ncbi:MAG: endonuclease III [Muribaculaceae bacterium]|nr:endonuclease III [Muribaculaceae bacterium]
MTIKERYAGVLDYFQHTQPNPTTELQYSNAFEILVAVILSAQCTDKRVNMVTPSLFAAYPTPQLMSQASVDDILHFVKSVSYPNSKALHLKQMSQMLVDKFGGEVPDTLDELTQLHGVGRKSANVMLGLVFGQAAIAVDTHVFRVSNRLGLSHGKTPLEVEKSLTRHIPAELRFKAHHWILLHGRYVCKANRPDCLNCGIKQWCKTYQSAQASR